jgi:scyllo-inositol 2-dehydrogenase (NADP+)
MNKTHAMGVLGLGRMGQVHCRQIAACPGLRLLAGSSGSPELRNAVAEEFDVRVYDDHEALLRDPEIEWVVVATTTDRHMEWALKAVEQGKNLIVEKPIAPTLAETRQIVADAERRGSRLTVYNSRRWDPDFRLVRRVLAEGSLGEVYRIESRYTHFDAGWGAWGAQGEKNPWRLKKAYGGGILSDWGPHLFDQILLLMDCPIRSVFGKLYSKIWSSEVEDHFLSELLFEGGTTALVEASNNHRVALPRWCILGTGATLWIEGGSPSAWSPAIVRRGSGGGALEEIRQELPHEELSSGFYRDFVKALNSGAPLPVQLDQVLRVMELIEAVRRSDAEGGTVFVS